eukprot:958006-Prymnesium_polylepis.1
MLIALVRKRSGGLAEKRITTAAVKALLPLVEIDVGNTQRRNRANQEEFAAHGGLSALVELFITTKDSEIGSLAAQA